MSGEFVQAFARLCLPNHDEFVHVSSGLEGCSDASLVHSIDNQYFQFFKKCFAPWATHLILKSETEGFSVVVRHVHFLYLTKKKPIQILSIFFAEGSWLLLQ